MKTKEFELSFRNSEVRMYTAIILPAIFISLLIILLSPSESKSTYALIVQMIGFSVFYSWRFFCRGKEKFKNSG